MSDASAPADPAKPSPRLRRREANLARITEAATQIVVDEGIDALSIKRVADDALYTPGALYRYFDSKDALLSAVAVVLMKRVQRRLVAVANKAADAHLDSALAQVLTYCRYAQEDPHGFGLFAKLVSEPGHLIEDYDVAGPALDAMFETLTPLSLALSKAAENGDLTPGNAAERSVVFFAAVQGVLMLRKQERLNPDTENTDLFVQELIRTLMIGWGADPAAVDAALASAKRLCAGASGGEPE